jgi:guanylate kinase
MNQAARQGLLFIVSAASGTGKTSLVHALIAADGNLAVSVSHTTRPRRPGEQEGADYHFVDPDTFQDMAERGDFLEDADVFGNRYGTSRSAVDDQLNTGLDVILEIDWQGARQVRAAYPHAASIFILPPSRAALVQRLEGRGLDAADVIEARSHKAREEISHYAEYEYLVVNDDFATALEELSQIIAARRLGLQPQRERLESLLADLLREQ